ncbi:hypothetical protein ABT136_30575, partial [Streptomyces sp. NPDC001856]
MATTPVKTHTGTYGRPYGRRTAAGTGTGTAEGTAEPVEQVRLWPPGGRGRHRRPRPRKVLLVAGGLALAAGALSLVRLTPDSPVPGIGTAEADPRLEPTAEST